MNLDLQKNIIAQVNEDIAASNDDDQVICFTHVPDCTHVAISSTGGEQAEIYRNRKGFLSINVQAVCDARLVFTNIVARWPGSVHDATILNHSLLCAQLESGALGDGVLLGDGGYACKSYLLTPLLRPTTAAERRYQYAHIRTRNPIER